MAAPTRFPNGVTNVARTADTGMLPFPDPTQWHVYFNDFDEDLVSWVETATSVGAGTSAAAITDADGGLLRITTAAADNDALWIASQGESFTLESGKRFIIKGRFRASKSSNGDIQFGLHVRDTTPLDAAQRAVFVKLSGTAQLTFNVDDGTTDVSSANLGLLDTDTFVTLTAFYDGKSSIHLFYNGAHVDTMTGVSFPAGEMVIGLGYQNGNASASTCDYDYLLIATERA